MKGFKGTDKNGKCRGFQYEENHDYEFESAELCKSGGHFCTEPLDVFRYYPPSEGSRYFVVESADEDVSSKKDKDSKRVTKKLHIGKEINIKGLIKEHINFVNENIIEHNIKREDFGKAIAGRYGAATVGDNGVALAGIYGAATAGDSGAATVSSCGAAIAGDYGVATIGNYGIAKAGYQGIAIAGKQGAAITNTDGIATTGRYGVAITGDAGIATAGEYGAATAGDRGVVTVGKNGAATTGNFSIATADFNSSVIAGRGSMATAGSFSSVKVGDTGMAMAGNYGTAIAGNQGVATTNECSIAIAGERGIATSRGSSSVGTNGSALARGNKVKVRGGLGAILVLVEEEEVSYDIKEWKAFVIDGDKYKPNVWYQLKDGEVVEVKEEDE